MQMSQISKDLEWERICPISVILSVPPSAVECVAGKNEHLYFLSAVHFLMG